MMFEIVCIGGSIAGDTASIGIAIAWFVVVVVEGHMRRLRRRSGLWWYTESPTSIRVTMKCD
jgi:2-polyprenyl-6-methoxyphenol hydroxylase-like FAD-dependent oxidoreductase